MLYRHAGPAQRLGVGLALVAEHVVLDGEDAGRGSPAGELACIGEASGEAESPSGPR